VTISCADTRSAVLNAGRAFCARRLQKGAMMSRRTTFTLTIIPLMCLAVSASAGNALAQQKEHFIFKSPAEYNKVTKQQNIDVEDVPLHVVRVFEIHRAVPINDPPVINGLKLVDAWERGFVDLIAGNGFGEQYTVYMMENGDRFFSRSALVLQSSSGKITATGAGYITGGTGKFAAIQGTVRGIVNIDPKGGSNDGQFDVEYMISK
jgi:hypothetical protein